MAFSGKQIPLVNSSGVGEIARPGQGADKEVVILAHLYSLGFKAGRNWNEIRPDDSAGLVYLMGRHSVAKGSREYDCLTSFLVLLLSLLGFKGVDLFK